MGTAFPEQSISYKIACAPSKDSDQPAHQHSLIKVFAGQSIGSQGSKAIQRALWSDCADTQADLSLRWVHMQSCRKCFAPVHFLNLLRISRAYFGVDVYQGPVVQSVVSLTSSLRVISFFSGFNVLF